MKLLTRADLDAAECNDPDCKHEQEAMIFIKPDCHPETPVFVAYNKKSGALVLFCSECGDIVTRIKPGE